MKKIYQWDFPLPRTHTGMLLGNGLLGAMVWGGESILVYPGKNASLTDAGLGEAAACDEMD